MSQSAMIYALLAAADHSYPNHPECPGRVKSIQHAIDALTHLTGTLVQVHATDFPAIEQATLHAVHSPPYLLSLKQRCAALTAPTALVDADDPDGPTYATPTSYTTALQAAAAAVALVDAVLSHPTPPPPAFSMCRPPGHHANSAAGPLGFCLVNSVAVAARHAQQQHGIHKIAIIDWDVHVGNGTCDIFYEDPSVLFIDMHRQGVWPGTGSIEERGRGPGLGTTVHVPLPAGAGHSAALAAFEGVVDPALRRFQPGMIFVSCGFDAHWRDPLECLQFQSATYHALAAGVKRIADEICHGRCVLVLEGGYSLQAVGEAAAEVVRALVGEPPATPLLGAGEAELPQPEPSSAEVAAVVAAVRAAHQL